MADATRTLEVRIESIGADALKSIAEHFGNISKTGERADRTLRKVGKSSKKAGRDVGDLATMFRDMDGVGLRVGDTIDQLSVLMSGPLGLALGGAVIGFTGLAAAVGGTAASIALYIGSSKRLTKSADKVVGSFKAMVANFGRAIVGGNKVIEVFELLAKVFEDSSDAIVKDSARIHGVFRDIALGAIEVARPFAMMGATLGGMASVIGDAFDLSALRLKRFVNTVKFTTLQAVGMVVTGVETVKLAASGGSVEQIETLIKRAKFGVETLGRVRDEVDAAIEMQVESTAGNLAKGFRKSIDAAADVDTSFNEARNKTAAFFDKPIGGHVATASDFEKKGKAAKGTTMKDVIKAAGLASMKLTPEAVAKLSAAMDGAISRAEALVEQGNFLRGTFEGGFAKGFGESLGILTDQDNFTRLKSYNEAVADLGSNIGGALSSSFVQLGSSVGTAMGAFAAGTQTLGAFGDAMLDMFGDLAGTIGQFFIKTGVGMMFINPGAGLGLIAAGIGLSALGGFLGGKGSGNAGSGSRGGSAGPSSSAFDPIDPRRQGQTREDTINITIEGDTIARAVDNSARRGVMRNVQVRLA